MRLERLDLVRYGHFTDRGLDLQASPCDLYIVFGPNEAGKSTTLAAVGDLLFGMPQRTPFGFRHGYGGMLLGALLQDGDARLEVRRRKGNANTLLDNDGEALAEGETALRPYLATADRAFFERMFSLDHVRLEAGGRDILDASDDIGQMLFSAGTGIAGLRRRLAELESDADAIWGKRRAGHRRFTQAESRLKDARALLREQTLTSKTWLALKRDLETAEATLAEVTAEAEGHEAEARRLARIRRVHPHVVQKAALTTTLDDLGEVVELSEAARPEFEGARRTMEDLSTQIEVLNSEVATARAAAEAAAHDGTLPARADEIEDLGERRLTTAKEVADLPNRRVELAEAQARLRNLAGDIGWHGGGEEIAPRTVVAGARALLTRRGEITSEQANRAEALDEAEARLADRTAELAALPPERDLGDLARALAEVERDDGGFALLGELERRAGETATVIAGHLAALHPAVDDVDRLARLAVPARATVMAARDNLTAWEQRRRDLANDIETAERELDTRAPAYEQAARADMAIAPEVLDDARARRDDLWRRLRPHHVAGPVTPVDDEDTEILALDFETAITDADSAADLRFEKAEAVGRLAEMARALAELHDRLARLHTRRGELESEGEALEATWIALWAPAGLPPREPESMLEWLTTRDAALESAEAARRAERDAAAARERAQAAVTMLCQVLGALNIEPGPLTARELPRLRDLAADTLRASDAERADRTRKDEAVREVRGERNRCRRDAARAAAAWDAWNGEWEKALTTLGLPPASPPAAVAAQLDVLDEMRALRARIDDTHLPRIAKMERDVALFEKRAAALVAELAPDLASEPPDLAARTLEVRLAEARRLAERERSARGDVERLDGQRGQLHRRRDEAAREIERLRRLAGVESDGDLERAIAASDERRRRRAELAQTPDTLTDQGDGLAIEDLERECLSVDIDLIAARESSVAEAARAARDRLTEASAPRTLALEAYRTAGGDGGAARAETRRQEAIAALREAASSYTRTRGAAILLGWAIERYLRDMQTPLRVRAATHFATITGGAFAGLDIDYDERDQAAWSAGGRTGKPWPSRP